ncbi:uncharacterized protein LOC125449662 [Stegostoma tigrinum]|uniref:uncharacterized protein LOC125449662 n=1 Tax=Stegostoma tigrinum TaxID=3053191 RepID=UPI00202AFB94|nr:uncharacterized protein LOC125449662 [Stegostoma tigrinum]
MNIITLCTLFGLFPGTALHKMVLQTPRLQTVFTGSIVKLNCHMDWAVSGHLHWYKQQVRGNLKKVYIMDKNFISNGKKISGEINHTSSIYTLVIGDVQVTDSGRYYCAAWKFYGMPLTFGNGSILLVTDGMNKISGSLPSRIDSCHLILYGSLLAIGLLTTVTVAAAWSYRKQNSGDWITDNNCKESRLLDQKQQTLYAPLVFTVDQTL